MIDFASVKGVHIPEGDVSQIEDSQGNVLWNILPNEYKRLEYLESSGTQYIDTGIVPTARMATEADYYIDAAKACYGARWTGSPTYDTFGEFRSAAATESEAKIALYYGNYKNGYMRQITIPATSRFVSSIGTTMVSLNGVSESITRGAISTNLTMYLFAMNVSGTASFMGMCRIYSLRIYDGELIADYIPCRRRADGVLGMYDLVARRFLTNAGTGTFIAPTGQ